MFSTQIPVSVRTFAVRHQINVGRDEVGYFVRENGFIVESTRIKNPTAANARAMVKRHIRAVSARSAS